MECSIIRYCEEKGGKGMKISEGKKIKLKASLANISLFVSIFSIMSLVLITMTAPTASAKTITVPDDYLTIQEAIDNADPGDTVYVRNGTYVEDIEIPLTINLTGESRTNTTIDADHTGTVITISASWVNVTGFTQFGLLL